ncbi:hypothetical protein BJ684DRAFT_16825 [Piptocephalis cylindrospora]|uniref:Metaxin glutathione S-transferase domain-containing protein n=1 Tax=Piptocephalis cylindrospora TaxID=1907219 RepID=A0A4P9Y1P0_9FUNG|nr:hypothetical protein BJ684DRAFT_16825 [Piptocephalis cylindrospora]|eukprot:RKP12717.1 hypothetical protein BJ684DRAFT_16825 [Piptocephalis cylindrospora]
MKASQDQTTTTWKDRLGLPALPLRTVPAPEKTRWPVEKPRLYIQGPSWIPSTPTSSDPSCLSWQVWFRTRGIGFTEKWTTEPEASSTGHLPFLATPDHRCFSGERLNGYLDEALGKEPIREGRSEEAKAFATLLATQLKPALLYHLWCEPRNFAVVVQRLGAHYPSVVRRSIMEGRRLDHQKELACIWPGGAVYTRTQVYEEADRALRALEDRLVIGKDGAPGWLLSTAEEKGSNSDPTFADCLAFAYLHTILTAPLADLELQSMVLKRPILVTYTQQAYKHWFPDGQ